MRHRQLLVTGMILLTLLSLLLIGCSSDDDTDNTQIQPSGDSTLISSPESPSETSAVSGQEITSENDVMTQTPPVSTEDETTPSILEEEKAPPVKTEEVHIAETDQPEGLSWTFTEDDVNFNIPGVSPEAILLEDGSVRLYVTNMGTEIYRADDGLNFSKEKTVAQNTDPTSHGSDPTLIKLDDGNYRMYYVDQSPQGTKEVHTATSADGLNWTWESATGIQNTDPRNMAWGVPDTIELPNGSIRIYWVDMPQNANRFELEVIRSAIAADGVNFTVEEGYRTEDGFVDSYILSAEEGNWLGLFATTPARLPQRIHIGTSEDGLSWNIDPEPVITNPGGNALDPTAVRLDEDTYRVYYSTTSGNNAFEDFAIKSGILKIIQ